MFAIDEKDTKAPLKNKEKQKNLLRCTSALPGVHLRKVAIDARLIQSSGIGRFIKNLVSAIKESSFSLSLLGYAKDEGLLASYRPQEIIRMTSPIYSIKEQLELFRKIPKSDLFISPHFNIPLLPIRAKKRITVIHDVYHLAHQNEFPWWSRFFLKMMYRQAIQRSDLVVTVSHFSKNEILRYLNVKGERIEVIYNGLSLSHFSAIKEESVKARLREKYGLSKRIILAVGNVKPHKNLARLISAVEAMKEEVELVIVGKREGFYQDEKIVASKRVRFLGEIDDLELVVLYSISEVMVFPSLYEGFGLPPLEAMAIGCPVIASTAASLTEILGEAPLYIDPLSVKSIQEAIESVLGQPELQKEMIRKGFLQAAKYSEEKAKKSLLNLLHNVIEEVS